MPISKLVGGNATPGIDVNSLQFLPSDIVDTDSLIIIRNGIAYKNSVKNLRLYANGLPQEPNATSDSIPDLYSTALWAFSSHRKLIQEYTGFARKIRRTSNNALQDIGFNGNNVDTTLEISFIGSSNGIVDTWYNQADVNNNFVYGGGSGFFSINAGELQRLNNKSTFRINNSFYRCPVRVTFQDFAIFAVFNTPTNTDGILISPSDANRQIRINYHSSPGIIGVCDGAADIKSDNMGNFNSATVCAWVRVGANYNFYKNKVLLGTRTGGTSANHRLNNLGGLFDNSFGFNGNLSELIVFDNPTSSERITNIFDDLMVNNGIVA